MFCYVLYVLTQVSKPLMLSFLLYKTNQCLVVSLYYTVLRIIRYLLLEFTIRKRLFLTARIVFAS